MALAESRDVLGMLRSQMVGRCVDTVSLDTYHKRMVIRITEAGAGIAYSQLVGRTLILCTCQSLHRRTCCRDVAETILGDFLLQNINT